MLSRYFLRETLGAYLAGILLFVTLRTTDLLSSLSGTLLRQHTPLRWILELLLYRLPDALGIGLAFGLVFGLLLVFARWIRQSELKAAFAAGMPPWQLLWPTLLLGASVSLLAFFNWGWLRPLGQARFEQLLYRVYYGGYPSGVLSDQVYTPQGYGIFFAQEIIPHGHQAELRGIHVVEPDGRIVSAPRGLWKGGIWRLEQANTVLPSGAVSFFPKLQLKFPKAIPIEPTPFNEMTLPQLRAEAQLNPQARFSLTRRYTDALAALVLAWSAAVLGLSLKEPAWAFIGILLILLGYYLLWTLAARFALYGLWGSYGAWLPDLACLLFSVAGSIRLRFR